MKRTFLLILIVLTLASFFACSACNNQKKKETDMVSFKSGIYFNKNWSETVGTYGQAVVPNEKVALEIAQSIFNGMDKSEEVQKYIPQTVFFDEQENIWIVSFWKEADEAIVGGDCNIAIQKEDGKVLRIWFGE